MDYHKYAWETIACDYNSPFFRNHIVPGIFFIQAQLLFIPRVTFGVVSKNNNIEYITDMSTWIRAHEHLREQVTTDYHVLTNLLSTINECGQNMNEWTEKNIMQADLTKLNGEQLVTIIEEFIPMQATMYAYGIGLVLLDFDKFSFVEGNLRSYLEKNVTADEFSDYFATFTAPPRFSCSQEQELALLSLMEKYVTDEDWKKDVMGMNITALEIKYPEFIHDLEEHTAKYSWVYFVYMGPAFTSEQFLDFVRDYLHRGVDPKSKQQEIHTTLEEIKKNKEAYCAKLKPTEFERAIIDFAGLVVWSKPRRKDYQSKSYYHIEKIQREIAKRLALTLDQVRSAPIEVLRAGLNGGEIDVHLINQIRTFHVCLANEDGTVKTLVGKEAEEFDATVIRKNTQIDYTNITEVKGSTACAGVVEGVVKMVNVPGDMVKMNYGDILISTATTPSIVAAMKKAGAIVTDEGGLTCHASIVSRELNIPCVVGTKFGTKVFKDGDKVRVDSLAGTIKKV